MTEDIYTIQKTKDKNLREAIMQEEMTRPPLPSDINARLMKRVAKEENRKRSLRLGWPWIAAACLAVVITMVLPHTRSANDTSTSEKHETIVKTKKAQKRETIISKYCCPLKLRTSHTRTRIRMQALKNKNLG